MEEAQYSKKGRKELIFGLKKDLEREGFKTSWHDPFLAWMHGENIKTKDPQREPKNTFYIYDLPIPKMVPFDLAAVSITVNEEIYFQLSLYYVKVLENEVDGDAINNIFDRHATKWSVKRTDYFSDVALQYSLLWDTEYDVYIEDNLQGQFPIKSQERIISIMNDIKERYLEDLYNRIRQKYEEDVKALEREKPNVAEQLKALKYSVFYTNPLNTLKEGPVYYLGFNPGGSIEKEGDFKNFEDLTYFKEKKKDWCDFVDEAWPQKDKTFPPGKAPLQRRVKVALEEILSLLNVEVNIRNVFCTNLYFFRSNKAVDIFEYEKYDCWNYHKEFLKIVRPKLIVCNGNGEKFSAYANLKNNMIKPSTNMKKNEPSHQYGKYFMKSFLIENSTWGISNVLVIGFPHLSRFAADSDEHKPKWFQYIKKYIT
ncbi:MAG: hypothetical protein JXB42_11520 [Deltaproteobacteria bacterium]|nr:hypothetical protein [Deltaproteobacteria bacterium]